MFSPITPIKSLLQFCEAHRKEYHESFTSGVYTPGLCTVSYKMHDDTLMVRRLSPIAIYVPGADRPPSMANPNERIMQRKVANSDDYVHEYVNRVLSKADRQYKDIWPEQINNATRRGYNVEEYAFVPVGHSAPRTVGTTLKMRVLGDDLSNLLSSEDSFWLYPGVPYVTANTDVADLPPIGGFYVVPVIFRATEGTNEDI